MSAHRALREATRAAHDRVDAIFSHLDLADPADYARFLTAQAAAFIPAETALSDAGAARLVEDWDALRRAPLLTADLAALGIAPPAPATPPDYRSPAAILGGMYVLEGSRLGGAMLRRSVPADFPRGFLDSVQPPGRWRSFTRLLDRSLATSESLALASESALLTFTLFERTKREA